MLSKERKKEIVEELGRIIEERDSVFFVDFAGLSTPELNDLKSDLREKGSAMKVVKKSLLPFVSKKSGTDLSFEGHRGSVAFIYGEEEGIQTAKSMTNFSKKHDKLVILGGLFQKSFTGPEKVRQLASLPSREEIVQKLMYVLNPAGSFVRVLSSPMAGLVNVVGNIKSKKQ